MLLPEHQHGQRSTRINELELADVRTSWCCPAPSMPSRRCPAQNAIATSCTMPLAKARIAAADLVPPSVLVTADQVEHGKPAPDPYLWRPSDSASTPSAAWWWRTPRLG